MSHPAGDDEVGRTVITTVPPPKGIGGRPVRELHVVLVEPQIPPNTGNIARLCAATGAWLHLVRPLAFDLDHAKLKRAGLDYWPKVRLSLHDSFEEFITRCDLPAVTLFSKRAARLYTEIAYPPSTVLVFGQETRGLRPEILERFSDRLAYIPISGNVRSLNLSNAVSVAVYEVVRQHGGLFPA
ncbi:MAG: tRNA (cytidine(34)-2'-O)-methyltransferase [Bradymonadales bacterium]|nr:tRNA (cytidine(34)-2'-O)-methyltransferase [Bradymonadales bacterium]